MNEITIFNYGCKEIRTVMKNGEPWWVLKDVCEVLGLSNSRMVSDRLDEDELMSVKLTSGGQMREMTVVNESGLYNVILRSDKPNAKAFKKWVTSEVLPSIRKHGGYLTPAKIEEAFYNPDALMRLATVLKEEREKREALEERVVEMKPKADYFDHVVDKGHLTNIRDTAKQLGIREREFTKWLKDKKYIYYNARRQIRPYGKAVHVGILQLKEWEDNGICGEQTMVTILGKRTFLSLLTEEGRITPVKKKPPIKKKRQ